MDSNLQAELQAVADKFNTQLSVSITLPPVESQTETVNFTPAAPAV